MKVPLRPKEDGQRITMVDLGGPTVGHGLLRNLTLPTAMGLRPLNRTLKRAQPDYLVSGNGASYSRAARLLAELVLPAK